MSKIREIRIKVTNLTDWEQLNLITELFDFADKELDKNNVLELKLIKFGEKNE